MDGILLEGVLIDAGYVNLDNRSTIRLTLKVGREISTLFDFSFHPYFYLIPSSKYTDPKMLEGIKVIDNGEEIGVLSARKAEIMLKGEMMQAFAVEVATTRHVPRMSDHLREFGSVYENDILFWKRYMIDKRISPLSGVRVKAHEENGMLAVDSIEPMVIGDFSLNYVCFDIETYNPKGVMPTIDL